MQELRALRTIPRAAVAALFAALFAACSAELSAALTTHAGAAAQSREQVYATVLNANQTPATGLGTADFVLRDGGTRIAVLNAAPADEPLSVAIVIAGFDRADRAPLQSSVEDAARALTEKNAAHRIGIVDAGHGGSRVTMLDASGAGAADAIGALLDQRTDPAALLIAAAESLSAAPSDRRIVLVLLKRQSDDGERVARDRREAALRAIVERRTAVWTIDVAPERAFGAADAAGVPNALDEMLDEGARLSGAIRARVNAAPDLPAAARLMAARWLSQYVVTYTWPEPMVSQFSLVTRHDAGEVLYPVWRR